MNKESAIEIIIPAKGKDLGGLTVYRALPMREHPMVGPFIFFDHMGPADFGPGQSMNVRPHPHINLATVTYLFEGQIQHRDSLGSNQLIEPGAVNWMTAGKGIVHSERAPQSVRDKAHRIHGIQLWVALPTEEEECAPSFTHHSKQSLPEFQIEKAWLKLLLGKAFGHQSPAKVFSDLFYLEVRLPTGAQFTIPADVRETGFYLVEGKLSMETQELNPCSMLVLKKERSLVVTALEDSRAMLLGGNSVGPRFIEWNFVSSSKERIVEAKKEWAPGPRKESSRFPIIPGDDKEFIPLP